MDNLLNTCSNLFDTLRNFWHRETTHKTVSALLVLIFLLSLAVIEFNRHGMLPSSLADKVPTSHYMAINLAFLLVLIMERISMIVTLPGSMSMALGKQFEILALSMLVVFCGMGMYNGVLKITGQPVFNFFQSFYTVLIFSDILMVLLAQIFLPKFPAVFRNSGYARPPGSFGYP